MVKKKKVVKSPKPKKAKKSNHLAHKLHKKIEKLKAHLRKKKDDLQSAFRLKQLEHLVKKK